MLRHLFLITVLLLSSFNFLDARTTKGARIVNGTPATSGQFPFMAQILFDGSQGCGGSILSPTWVLTAAHCTIDSQASEVQVLVGTLQTDGTSDSTAQVIQAKKIVNHPEYNEDTLNKDVSLIELETPLTFNTLVDQLYLMESDPAIPETTTTYSAGWGATAFEGEGPAALLFADLPLVSFSDCSSAEDATTQICAGGINSKDTCQGDSGGPLFQKIAEHWEQIGVVSFGEGCGSQPGVYAKVPGFAKPWVEGVIGFSTSFNASGEPVAVCGNNIVELGEACDGGSCCSKRCQFKRGGKSCGPRQSDNGCWTKMRCNGNGECRDSKQKKIGKPCSNRTGKCDSAGQCALTA